MTTCQKRLGILLISAARHQEAFATVFADHPCAMLVAVADEPNGETWIREANQQLAARWGVPYTEDLAAALARPDVDVVSIGSLYRRHASLAVQALRAGKHVLLDKQPIGLSLDEGRAVADAAREAAGRGVKLTYLHHSHDAAIQRARRLIDRGEIGRPLAVFATMIGYYGPGDDPDTSPFGPHGLQYHPSWWDGGELIHFGGYGIAAARFMMQTDVTSVFAVTGSHFNRLHQENEIEDLATLSLRYAGGGVGTVVVGRAPNRAATTKGEMYLHVLGTEGAVTADWEAPHFLLESAAAGRGCAQGYGRRGNTPVIHDFLDAILEGRETVHGAQDGLADLEVLLAGRQSARDGRPVDLPLREPSLADGLFATAATGR